MYVYVHVSVCVRGSRGLISLWPHTPWLRDVQCQDFAFRVDVICRAKRIDVASQHHTPPTHHASLLSHPSFPTDNDHAAVWSMYVCTYVLYKPTHTQRETDCVQQNSLKCVVCLHSNQMCETKGRSVQRRAASEKLVIYYPPFLCPIFTYCQRLLHTSMNFFLMVFAE